MAFCGCGFRTSSRKRDLQRHLAALLDALDVLVRAAGSCCYCWHRKSYFDSKSIDINCNSSLSQCNSNNVSSTSRNTPRLLEGDAGHALHEINPDGIDSIHETEIELKSIEKAMADCLEAISDAASREDIDGIILRGLGRHLRGVCNALPLCLLAIKTQIMKVGSTDPTERYPLIMPIFFPKFDLEWSEADESDVSQGRDREYDTSRFTSLNFNYHKNSPWLQ